MNTLIIIKILKFLKIRKIYEIHTNIIFRNANIIVQKFFYKDLTEVNIMETNKLEMLNARSFHYFVASVLRQIAAKEKKDIQFETTLPIDSIGLKSRRFDVFDAVAPIGLNNIEGLVVFELRYNIRQGNLSTICCYNLLYFLFDSRPYGYRLDMVFDIWRIVSPYNKSFFARHSRHLGLLKRLTKQFYAHKRTSRGV